MSIEEKNEWPDDRLNRKSFADYLTKVLIARSDTATDRGLTISLDAEWGDGKSFFCKKWADDLKSSGHPIVYFDAWQNDIGDEAVLALMSAIYSELDLAKKKLPADIRIQNSFSQTKKKTINKLRKAIVPLSKVILTGAAKKLTGVGIQEIAEVFADEKSDHTQSGKKENGKLIDFENELDKVFELKIGEHQARKDSINEFKAGLKDLLDLLLKVPDLKLPLFIFVDELDRCRPTYAIKLLEEIKHLFGIESVVFIVSTNMKQLTNSVRAQYGESFDAEKYLKRFFDREYIFPEKHNYFFAKELLDTTIFSADRKMYSGLPHDDGTTDKVIEAWNIVVDATGLDLRSQKQVIAIVFEAILSLPSEKTLHMMWLFFIAAAYHRAPDGFKGLQADESIGSQFNALLNMTIKNDAKIKWQYRDYRQSHEVVETHCLLSNLIKEYFKLSQLNDAELFREDRNDSKYPHNLSRRLTSEEFNGTHIPSKPRFSSISSYIKVIVFAGSVIQ